MISKFKINRLSILFVSFALVSCSSGTKFSSTAAENNNIYDTRSFLLPQCVQQKEAVPSLLIPLITTLASKGLETGLDLIGKWVEKQKQNQKASYSARAASYFFIKANKTQMKPAIGCVVVTRGWFGPPLNDPKSNKGNSWKADNLAFFGLAKLLSS